MEARHGGERARQRIARARGAFLTHLVALCPPPQALAHEAMLEDAMGAAGGIVSAERRVQNVLWKIQATRWETRVAFKLWACSTLTARLISMNSASTRAARRLKRGGFASHASPARPSPRR